MTALQAAGGGLPLALHIPHVVEQAGALAGFAAVIGLAVLSALYFSQARDLRRLREWAGRAPERAAEGQQPLPGRVVPVPQQRPGPATPGATNGDAAPSVAVGPAAPAAAGVVAAPGEGAESANQAEGAKSGEAKEDEAKPGEGEGDGTKDGEGDEAGPTGADETDKPEGAPGAAKPEGAPDAAKPGMPAPASAAAAAGAGAASALGPAAAGAAAGASAAKPPTPGAPGAPSGPARPGQPQRPPGSVLPPRTGTLPPVRRLPSSTVGPGPAQTGVLGSAPSEKNKRNPVYVVLAVAGVLILGAAAAIGVPALVNGSKNDNKKTSSTSAKKTSTTTHKAAPAVSPDKITVAVLNGTAIPGLAAQVGDRVDADGFTLGTVSNASQTQGQRANSVAMYAPGHERDARRVARKLGISNVSPTDSNSRSIAGDASVVVIVGSDKTQ